MVMSRALLYRGVPKAPLAFHQSELSAQSCTTGTAGYRQTIWCGSSCERLDWNAYTSLHECAGKSGHLICGSAAAMDGSCARERLQAVGEREHQQCASAVYDVWKEFMLCLQVFTGELFRCIRDIDRTAVEIASDSPGTSLPDFGQIRYVCRPRMAKVFPTPVKPRRVPAWTGVYGQRDDIGLEQARVGLCGSCLHTPMSDSSTMSQDTNTDEQHLSAAKGPSKTACTVCRAAKMKCVGADIKSGKSCDRCTKQVSECVFEQHRRGRKPGSVLSDSSKELRRLEKHRPSSTKGKGSALKDRNTPWNANSAMVLESYTYPPSNGASDRPYDGQCDDEDENSPLITPAVLIDQEYKRQTSLDNLRESPPSHWSTPTLVKDPVSAGILDEATARTLFDLLFLHNNQFICLFDRALHSFDYVRSQSPFLLTVLLMVGSKFFQHEIFTPCQALARELAARAMAEDWKSVEVVQAFACLCYWEEPEDNRSWTYIGHACRMAIELGLNRYHAAAPIGESEVQRRVRRNRERTYLILFVHDRSLALHTGRPWMLPKDEIVRNAITWHEQGGGELLSADVIVSAFVRLRCMIVESTDILQKRSGAGDPEYDVSKQAALLQSCNERLAEWIGFWELQMQRANGERFYFTYLKYMWLYVRVYVNSFGLRPPSTYQDRLSSHEARGLALSLCCSSAIELLQVSCQELAGLSVLRYAHGSIAWMNAYCAAFLLRVLRSTSMATALSDDTVKGIYQAISLTADAYQSEAASSPACTAITNDAQFHRSLQAAAEEVYNTRAAGGYTSSHSPVQLGPDQAWNQWGASQPSTSGYEPTTYASSWDMRTLPQNQIYPSTAPQVNATAYNSQHQFYAASAPATDVGAQPYWERVPQGVAGQNGTGFGVYTHAGQGYWHAG